MHYGIGGGITVQKEDQVESYVEVLYSVNKGMVEIDLVETLGIDTGGIVIDDTVGMDVEYSKLTISLGFKW
ncbi:MAG: hypothetical protein ACE5EA_11465 [Nitrospirota bacterium]